MATRPQPRGAQGGSLRRRWIRAFTTILLLSVLTGLTSLAVVGNLVGGLRRTAERSDRENALVGELLPVLEAEQGAAHGSIDFQGRFVGQFRQLDAEAGALFDDANEVFPNAAQAHLAAAARTRWEAAFADLRRVAGDPAALAALEAQAGSKDLLHSKLGTGMDAVRADVNQLSASTHDAVHDQLAASRSSERALLVVLGVLFAISATTTIYFARRMRRDVLRPVALLGESARQLAAGQFDHCRLLDSAPAELAEVADTFNVMVDALAANQRHLTTRAYHDSLTGLANRASFEERLARAFGKGTDNRLPTALGAANAARTIRIGVMFIDLDDFKIVNDSMGHAGGDELLRQVGVRLAGAVRSTDLVARIGGDEFAVLLAPAYNGQIAAQLAQRVVDDLGAPYVIEGQRVSISASVGVAIRDGSVASPAELVRRADTVMYLAKGRGKHRYEIYDPAEHDVLGSNAVAAGRTERAPRLAS